jgi:hypothetical protein
MSETTQSRMKVAVSLWDSSFPNDSLRPCAVARPAAYAESALLKLKWPRGRRTTASGTLCLAAAAMPNSHCLLLSAHGALVAIMNLSLSGLGVDSIEEATPDVLLLCDMS